MKFQCLLLSPSYPLPHEVNLHVYKYMRPWHLHVSRSEMHEIHVSTIPHTSKFMYLSLPSLPFPQLKHNIISFSPPSLSSHPSPPNLYYHRMLLLCYHKILFARLEKNIHICFKHNSYVFQKYLGLQNNCIGFFGHKTERLSVLNVCFWMYACYSYAYTMLHMNNMHLITIVYTVSYTYIYEDTHVHTCNSIM